MKKKPFDSVLGGAGADAQARSTGGGVEQRLLRIARRRRPARLHVVANLPLTLAAKRTQSETRAAPVGASTRAPADTTRAAANPAAPRLQVVVCKGAAGVFASKSKTSA
jgi:hypothetical protein